MSYFLETYCLLKYEASPELKAAILDNWLLNTTGLPEKCKEGDLMQEHKNRFLEEAVQKCGGEFDNTFFRKTISPNVDHFIRIKEQLSSAMGLDARGKKHTSRELDAELRVLLMTYKDEELHTFRSRRSMGHASKNLFNEGVKVLNEGKLKTFLQKSLAHADFVRKVTEEQGSQLRGSFTEQQHIAEEDTTDTTTSRMIQNNAKEDKDTDAEEDEADGPGVPIEEDCELPDALDDSERQLKSGSYGATYLDEDGEMVYGDIEEQSQYIDAGSDSDSDSDGSVDKEMGSIVSEGEDMWLSDDIPDANSDDGMTGEVDD